MMKIYTVTFNDGGWYTTRPEYQVVANSPTEAIEKVKTQHSQYNTGHHAWAVEFKIEGYVIEVYDEKTYNRNKNLEKLV